MKVEGIFKGATKNNAGYWSAIIHNTGLAKEDGEPANFFGTGKVQPKNAVGDKVRFEAEQNDRGYWNVKGKLEVIGGSSDAPSGGSAPASPAKGFTGRSNDAETRDSIEAQVAVKAAAEVTAALQLKPADATKFAIDMAQQFINLMAGTRKSAAAKAPPKPKPVEDQSQDPDDDIPY